MNTIDEAVEKAIIKIEASGIGIHKGEEKELKEIIAALREREAAHLRVNQALIDGLNRVFGGESAEAVKEALLAQPRAEVEASEERAMMQLIAERDERDEVIDKLLALLGIHPEWSNAYDFSDALEEAEAALLARAPRGESDAEVVQSLRAIDAQNLRDANARAEAAEFKYDALREDIKAVADKWRVLYGIDYSEEMADDLDALLRAETPEPAPNPEGRTCEMRLNSPESPDSSTGFGRHICWSCLRAKGSNAHASIHNLAKTDWCYVCEHRSEGINKPAASDGKGE